MRRGGDGSSRGRLVWRSGSMSLSIASGSPGLLVCRDCGWGCRTAARRVVAGRRRLGVLVGAAGQLRRAAAGRGRRRLVRRRVGQPGRRVVSGVYVGSRAPRRMSGCRERRRSSPTRPVGWPAGRSGWPWLALVIGTVILLGVLAAMAFDPQAAGCGDCAANLVARRHRPGPGRRLRPGGHSCRLRRVGRGDRHRRMATAVGRARRGGGSSRPTMLAGALLLRRRGLDVRRATAIGRSSAAARWSGGCGSSRPAPSCSSPRPSCGARLRNRRTRQSLVDVVVELGKTSATGGLRDALSADSADPDLEVGYAIGDGRWVTVSGTGRRCLPMAASGPSRRSCVTASRWR